MRTNDFRNERTNLESTKQIAKAYGCENVYSFFEYLYDIYMNGNFSETKKLYNEMNTMGRRYFISYLLGKNTMKINHIFHILEITI